jgi:general secretion pathway protein J
MKRKNGFTLIEILIALTIFSIMAVMGTTVLYSVFSARDRTTEHAVRLSDIQIAMVLLDRDITQILDAPLQLDNNAMEFTRGGMVNPLAAKKRSTLLRVSYSLHDKTLVRTINRLNQVIGTMRRDDITLPLLKKVDKLDITYMDKRYQTHQTWRARQLPNAIRITLSLDDFGEISELYLLPHTTHLKQRLKNNNKRQRNEN